MFEGIRREFGINVAGVAIGDDVETRRLGKAEGDGGRRVGHLDVLFGRDGKTHFDVAVAVVHSQFAAGVLDRNVIRIGPQRKVPGRIGDFKISRAGF